MVGITVAVGLAGFQLTRRWVRGVHGDEHSHNDVVSFYLAAMCVFYGITLGMLAIGIWQAYSDVDTKVGEEASVAAAIYRDVNNFSDPERAALQADLRAYVRQVVDIEWPLQRRGIVPQNTAPGTGAFLTRLVKL
jgi:Protein of unknown function (DUF4239)